MQNFEAIKHQALSRMNQELPTRVGVGLPGHAPKNQFELLATLIPRPENFIDYTQKFKYTGDIVVTATQEPLEK